MMKYRQKHTSHYGDQFWYEMGTKVTDMVRNQLHPPLHNRILNELSIELWLTYGEVLGNELCRQLGER